MKRILIAVLLLSLISLASAREVTIHLNAGLNFVGVPVDPGDWNISDLADHIGEEAAAIYFYSCREENCSFIRFPDADKEIVEGEAYVILMVEEKNVTFTGTPWDADGFITLDLREGLNPVSIPPGSDTSYTAETFLELDDALMPVMMRYNYGLGQFETYTPAGVAQPFIIEEGQGYIAYATENATIEIATKPRLSSWDLDMNTGLITLNFSKNIQDAGVNMTAITIVNTSSGDTAYRLTGTYTPGTGTDEGEYAISDAVLRFTLTAGDINSIKAIEGLATSREDTFLFTASGSGVQDLAGNEWEAISSAQAVQVTTYTNDTTPPEVANATLNYSSGELVVTFSEPVEEVESGTFHLNDIPGIDYITLTQSPLHEAATLTFTLTEGQRISALKISGVPGGNGDPVILDVDAAAVTDLAGNQIADSSKVVTEIPDTTAPEVTGWATLDYGVGVLVVTFSETIDASETDPEKFHINDVAGTDDVTLSNLPRDTDAITLRFILEEWERAAALAISWQSDGTPVVLDVDAIGVKDIAGNEISESDGNPVMEIQDMDDPSVIGATLDYNTGVLTVTFSETINAEETVPGGFHLRSATGVSEDEVTLTKAPDYVDAITLTFTLTEGQRVAALAISGVAGGDDSNPVVLDVDAGAVMDMGLNELAEDDYDNPVTEIADVTAPTVESATLDYNTGVLTVLFSETVDASRTVHGGFHLRSATGVSENQVTLTKAPDYVNAITLTFELTEDERVAALRISGVPGGDDSNPVVLDVDAGAVTDVVDNALENDDNNNPVTEIADTTAPAVDSATLDYSTGILIVLFSETIDAEKTVHGGFHLRSATGVSENEVTLSEAPDYVDAITLTFELEEDERVAALKISGVPGGDDSNPVVLDVDAGSVTDMGLNELGEDYDNPVTEIADTTAPTLLSWELNMYARTLTLHGSETLDASTLDVAAITIQDAETATASHKLTDSTTSSGNGINIVIDLSETDFNTITANTELATSQEDSYLTLTSDAINDMAGNPITAIPDGSGIMASAYLAPPYVINATLDYNTRKLVVTFSKTIDAEKTVLERFHLNDVTGTDDVTLSDPPLYVDSKILKFTLTKEEIFEAILISEAVDGTPVVLDMDAAAVTDMEGIPIAQDDNNPVTETPMEVSRKGSYSEKQIFLVSDENWKDVLSLVPVTTWTTEKVTDCAPDDERDWCWCNRLPEDYITLEDEGVCAYPTLIYHRENFDYVSHTKAIVSISTRTIYAGLSEDRIVYKDYRNEDNDIYIYDQSTGKEARITSNHSSSKLDPKISGNIIVWDDKRDGNYDIYMYDLSADTDGDGTPNYLDDDRPDPDPAERPIITNPNHQWAPSISGDNVVWVDNRTRNNDIYLFDIPTEIERQITSDKFSQVYPAISGDNIVWEDHRNGNTNIYVYDILTEEEKEVTAGPSRHPAISGDKIVWEDYRNGNWDVYMCDLSIEEGNEGSCLPGYETPIATDPSNQKKPAISGDDIVWTDELPEGGGGPAIGTYDERKTIHQESFDADSIIYFMQQYNPDNVILVGETPQELDALLTKSRSGGAGLGENQLHRIYPRNYLSYWDHSKLKNIVYVGDDYELALMASTYASLINAPLIVEGDINDKELSFANKDVILVGDVSCPVRSESCTPQLNRLDLQLRYIDMTETNKIILTNPDDLSIDIWQYLKQEKSMAKSFVLYSRNSLGAPILASAKHELIISTTSTNYQEVDTFIDLKIEELSLKPEYLTIIASPNAIEMTHSWISQVKLQTYYDSADAWQYSQIDDDPFLDLAVGRIFGLTVSDASSNIARSLSYEETLKNEDKILVTRGMPYITTAAEVYALGKVLSATGYQTTTTPGGTSAEDWKDKFFISYNDHGNNGWAGFHYNKIPWLDNPFVITMACLTCAFEQSVDQDGQYDYPVRKLFCANILRKGAIGYIGTVDTAGGINRMGFLAEIFAHESTIGKAFINSKNAVMITKDDFDNQMPEYSLLGDPTLKLKTIHTMPEPQLNFVSEDPDGRTYKLTVPAMRIEIPEYVKNLCGTPDQIVPLYFTSTDYTDNGYFSNGKFTARFDSLEEFEPGGIEGCQDLVKEPVSDGDYLWYKSPLGYVEYYFNTANDYEFTNFEIDTYCT